MANSDIVLNIVTKGAQLAKQQLGGLGNASKGSANNLAQLSKFAKIAGVAVGVALAKGVSVAVKEFIAFEDAMTQSLAIMKTTVDQQEDMIRATQEVAMATRIGTKDSAEAYFFLASAGLDAEQSIAALPQVARFAQAGMFDMATATDLATDAQSALGLTVQDAETNLANLTRVTDVLVKGNTLANASVQQFSEALTTKAGAALKVVNKDIEEGVAVLAVFADRGVKGAEAGDKLNQVLRDIPRATAKNRQEFEALGLNMFDTAGNMKNVADIIEELDAVLGPMSDEMKAATLDQLGLNRGVADAVKILSGSTQQIREYEAALRDSAGTTQEIADNQMKSLQAELDIVSNKWDIFLQLVGKDFEGAARGTVGWLDKILSRLIEIKQAQQEENEETENSVWRYRNKIQVISGVNVVYKEMYRVTKDLEKSHDDERDAVEAYIAGLEDLRQTTEEVEEATRKATEAEQEAAEERRQHGLVGLQAMQSAYQDLNAIYKRHNALKDDEIEAEKKLSKMRRKEEDVANELEIAKQKANDLAEHGTEVTNEENLAIKRQEQRIQELIAIEDKDEIQKLELAVAQERLNELREDSIARSRESVQAEEEVLRLEKELIEAEQRRIEAQSDLTDATKEYNDATAKTPENLLEIAIAKKQLDDAIADTKAMNSFNEGIAQMIKFAGGRLSDLRNHFNNIMGMSGYRADMVADTSGGGSTGGSIGFDETGVEDVSSPLSGGGGPSSRIASLADLQAGRVNNNNIVVNVGGALSSSDEISTAVASAMIQAQRRGIKVLI
jgi:TP901 family phage tail tape measure protein